MAENRYQQVMEVLRRRIEAGQYQAGERLPAETELAAALGVSRPTLRQALARLQSEGLLVRVKGSGTFVAQPKLLHESTSFLASYYQEAAHSHRTLRTEVLDLAVQRAGELGEKLALPAGSQVTRLVRRRRVEGFDNGRPVVYTTVYVPYALFPDMAQQDFTDSSFYSQLEARGLKVCRASRVLEVVMPPAPVAAALELSPFEPAIYVDSVGYDSRGRRVEYARSYYPAGSSKFLIEIRE
ncbi:GntR family transcriptional regulator [uncultured Gemmiger sp.]|uniref:GntR family transcriptional regulator n=1 Tax=uncultured Gemmiger sp. TaxID=1623490 RepID=UPI0025D2FEE3|nr:GntR family transcriptional regulator [uncultured Gemmiger sp.]